MSKTSMARFITLSGDIERPGDIEIPEAIEAAANFVADIFADNIFCFPSSVQVHDGADRHPGLG
ncbi:MAG: hypothetical protein GDA56_30135 [Hormoscilla sp. GM7CHS1pb]|nr:hypothetical protein [Hormoscilla sp. GM7CHS1pb]